MSVTREAAAQSVGRAIQTFNASEHANVPAAETTVLLGSGSAVDSLGLVRFILGVERQVEDDFGRAVSLTDEKAMSQRNSPFRTIATLTDYVVTCLNEPA